MRVKGSTLMELIMYRQGEVMGAKTVGIAISDELRPALDEVVEHFTNVVVIQIYEIHWHNFTLRSGRSGWYKSKS